MRQFHLGMIHEIGETSGGTNPNDETPDESSPKSEEAEHRQSLSSSEEEEGKREASATAAPDGREGLQFRISVSAFSFATPNRGISIMTIAEVVFKAQFK